MVPERVKFTLAMLILVANSAQAKAPALPGGPIQIEVKASGIDDSNPELACKYALMGATRRCLEAGGIPVPPASYPEISKLRPDFYVGDSPPVRIQCEWAVGCIFS
jgi:hypothetical protein